MSMEQMTEKVVHVCSFIYVYTHKPTFTPNMAPNIGKHIHGIYYAITRTVALGYLRVALPLNIGITRTHRQSLPFRPNQLSGKIGIYNVGPPI